MAGAPTNTAPQAQGSQYVLGSPRQDGPTSPSRAEWAEDLSHCQAETSCPHMTLSSGFSVDSLGLPQEAVPSAATAASEPVLTPPRSASSTGP